MKHAVHAGVVLGLMALAGCGSSTKVQPVENTGTMMTENMVKQADAMDAAAENSSNAMAQQMMQNSAVETNEPGNTTDDRE